MKTSRILIIIAALTVLIISLMIFLPPIPFILALAALAAVFIFSLKPEIGVFALILTFPFLGLRFQFPAPVGLLPIFPDGIDLPLVDIIGVLVLIAWAIRWLLSFDKKKLQLPLAFAFTLFLLSGAISLTNHPEAVLGFKYLVRPIAFAYLVFFLFPINYLQGKTILKKALQTFFALAFITALISMVICVFEILQGEFSRVHPPTFGALAPLGTNWNLLAEFLIPAVPVGIFFTFTAKKRKTTSLLILATVIITFAAVLTFARSAWISLAIVLLIFIVHFRSYLSSLGMSAFIFIVLATPALIGMIVFSKSYAAESSLSSRLFLTGIAVQAFAEEPLAGKGVGTFVDLVSSTRYFVLEFGDPHDAHGVIQKVIAEQGLIGLLTLAILFGSIVIPLLRALRETVGGKQLIARTALAMASSSLAYQFFNTSYYAGKMWLPIALAFAMYLTYIPPRFIRAHKR